jgi:hypothetical protein
MAVSWSLVIMPLIETGNREYFTAAVLVSYTIVGVIMSPLTALIPTAFAVRNRYTGAALANNLGAILGGAVPPVISPLLMEHGGGAVGAMMAGFSILSLVSVLMLRDVEASGHRATDERG